MTQAAVVPIVEERPEPDSTGYITDVPYVRNFIGTLAPALLDHVALISGFAPPDRENGFTYCDLGCGQGLTAAVLAGSHPVGVFHGVDFLPGHIDHARRFCAEAAISNATFHQADFRSATKLGLPLFDYIVCHGVYAWVNAQVQEDIRRFIDAQLKPGGLVYISYNAMPGWTTELPFQRLARALGQTLPGDSTTRITAGIEVIRAMAAAKVPSLVDSFVLKSIEERPAGYSPFYLAHEYMNSEWRPLFVTEVRAELSELGLIPVGSATLMDNFDSFVLGAKAREMLSSIADDDVRELARDYYIDQRFRRDVFIRDGHKLEQAEQRRRLLDSTFSLKIPNSKIEFSKQTPAGLLNFDNETAHAIVAALSNGPRLLADVPQDGPVDEQDLIANALTLCAACILIPIESSRVSVARLNQVIFDRLGGSEQIEFLVLPSGTAMPVKSHHLKALQRGEDAMAEVVTTQGNGNELDLVALKTFLDQQGFSDDVFVAPALKRTLQGGVDIPIEVGFENTVCTGSNTPRNLI
jgi:SAM-dependent methyltransferase